MTLRKLAGSRATHVPSADWGLGHLRAVAFPPNAGRATELLESESSAALRLDCIAFGSARTAIWAALKTAPQVRRVWIPAYTCVAVPNAVQAAGLEIEWVDVEGANIDLDAVLSAARPGDAVIAQHTYGIPIEPELLHRAQRSGLFVIEDRAHRFDGRDAAGDVLVYSLEHSKVVSGGLGGLAHVRDIGQRREMKQLQRDLPSIHDAVAWRVVLTSLGQLAFDWRAPILDRAGAAARRILLRLPPTSVAAQSRQELAGAGIAPTSPHPRLAALAVSGLERLRENLAHRLRICEIYRGSLPALTPDWVPSEVSLVRFPVVVPDADVALRACRRAGIDLGVRWFAAPVHPPGARSSYEPGAAPRAEALARTVLTLPTHARVTEGDAEQIARAVASVAGEQ